MKVKYIIKNLDTNKYTDWYLADYYEVDDIGEISNMIYSNAKEAEINLLKDTLSGKYYTIIQIYIND